MYVLLRKYLNMNHEECINTPFDRIFILLEEIQEQEIIKLDMLKMTLLSSVESIFSKKSKSIHEMVYEKKSSENDQSYQDFSEMMKVM
jgi:hypothetical protein